MRSGRLPANFIFPTETALPRVPYAGRHWPQQGCFTEPYYLCHHRLLFQQVNFERYGWDLGIATPAVCAAAFFKDVALLPYHFFMDPCRRYETNYGYCLPGDPVPLMLYPPELSGTGSLAEIGTIAALMAIFP
jgi:hypothetical protein